MQTLDVLDRHWLSGIRVVATTLASGLALLGCTSARVKTALPSAPPVAVANRFEFSQPQMGLPFRIVLYAPDALTARNAAQAAFTRIAALNHVLSDYEDDSELSLLSRSAGSGRAVPVSEDLWRVLHCAQELAARSDGAFDVTVGSAVQLWRRARRQQEMPKPDRLEQARQTIGYHKLVLNARRRTATLTVPGMRLDLGGIAKGYAVDEALKQLRAHGITRALVSGGGDLAVGDPPPGTRGWRIEIAPLDATNAPSPSFVLLQRCALATSGDLFQHVELNGTRYSHIVDPRTGVGLTDHSLVTIIAKNCTMADALSTAVSVLGPHRGLSLVEATPKTAAHIVRKPAERIEVFESKRFRKYIEAPPL